MTEKLKRCPFCNCKAEIMSDFDDVWVKCENCGAGTGVFDTKEEAVAAWNNRPTYEQLARENKILLDALDEIVNRNEFSRYCDMSQFDKAIEDFNIQIDGIPLIRIAQRALKEVNRT